MAGGVKFDDDEGIHEINVTPFVDVVLVLLVIFMVTAGFIVNRGVKVQLPEAATAEKLASQRTFNIVISIDGFLLLDGKPTSLEALKENGTAAISRGEKIVAMLSADKGVVYAKVVEVMDTLRLAGISDFALQLDASLWESLMEVAQKCIEKSAMSFGGWENNSELVTQFIRGARHVEPQKVGLEMEIFAYDAHTFVPLGLPGSRMTPQEVLTRVAKQVPSAKLKRDASTGEIIGLEMHSGANFSLEPGGQIEFSSAPHSDLSGVAAEVGQGLRQLEQATGKDVCFLSHGTNPITGALHPLLVPKERYLALASYFSSEPGGRGVHMSRNTATVQANLDVSGDVAWNDAVNLAWMLTPFAHRIFRNSFYFDGKLSAYASERQEIWNKTDRTRSGIPQNVPFSTNIPEAYATWAMDAYVLYSPTLAGTTAFKYGKLRFRDWLSHGVNGVKPSLQDWEIHLGTLFPELRLRGFLEVRSIDAQPFEHTMAAVAFWTVLLQYKPARDEVYALLYGYTPEGNNTALRDLLLAPRDSEIFDDTSLQKRILQIALNGLAKYSDPTGFACLNEFSKARFVSTPAVYPESGIEFVKQNATLTPSADFLRHTALAGTSQ